MNNINIPTHPRCNVRFLCRSAGQLNVVRRLVCVYTMLLQRRLQVDVAKDVPLVFPGTLLGCLRPCLPLSAMVHCIHCNVRHEFLCSQSNQFDYTIVLRGNAAPTHTQGKGKGKEERGKAKGSVTRLSASRILPENPRVPSLYIETNNLSRAKQKAEKNIEQYWAQ